VIGPDPLDATVVTITLVFGFFWSLFGWYAYREAKESDRSSPELRGVGWGVIGVLGVLQRFLFERTVDRHDVGWVALVLALLGFWVAVAVSQGPPGWYAWVGFYAALLIAYFKFGLDVLPGD
jgi:hypothetical protein